jgi:hypothetical protein
MALSRQEKKARNRNIVIIAGVVVLFLAMQSKSLVQALVAPTPAGYDKVAPAGQFTQLDWDSAQKARWVFGTPPKVPADVAALEGKPVTVRGFQLPLHAAVASEQWFLSPRPGGCFFCNPPSLSEVAQVNMADHKQVQPSNWQVDVYGTFHVAKGKPGDSVLYTIDNAHVVVAF